MRIRLVGAVLLVTVLGAACTAPVGGAAGPAPTPSAVAPPTTSPTTPKLTLPDTLLPPKVALPPRTRDVSLVGRDPCDVLTPAFAKSLGFDRPPLAGTFALLNDARDCGVSQNTRAQAFDIIFVTTLGIDIFNRAAVFSGDLTALDVAGFPALLVRPTVADTFCIVAVDIAPGEMIEIQVDEGGRKPTTPQEALCDSARKIAVRVVEAVVAG